MATKKRPSKDRETKKTADRAAEKRYVPKPQLTPITPAEMPPPNLGTMPMPQPMTMPPNPAMAPMHGAGPPPLELPAPVPHGGPDPAALGTELSTALGPPKITAMQGAMQGAGKALQGLGEAFANQEPVQLDPNLGQGFVPMKQGMGVQTNPIQTPYSASRVPFGGFRAQGGEVQAGKKYRVGENGPENLYLAPDGSGNIVPTVEPAQQQTEDKPPKLTKKTKVGPVPSSAPPKPLQQPGAPLPADTNPPSQPAPPIQNPAQSQPAQTQTAPPQTAQAPIGPPPYPGGTNYGGADNVVNNQGAQAQPQTAAQQRAGAQVSALDPLDVKIAAGQQAKLDAINAGEDHIPRWQSLLYYMFQGMEKFGNPRSTTPIQPLGKARYNAKIASADEKLAPLLSMKEQQNKQRVEAARVKSEEAKAQSDSYQAIRDKNPIAGQFLNKLDYVDEAIQKKYEELGYGYIPIMDRREFKYFMSNGDQYATGPGAPNAQRTNLPHDKTAENAIAARQEIADTNRATAAEKENVAALNRDQKAKGATDKANKKIDANRNRAIAEGNQIYNDGQATHGENVKRLEKEIYDLKTEERGENANYMRDYATEIKAKEKELADSKEKLEKSSQDAKKKLIEADTMVNEDDPMPSVRRVAPSLKKKKTGGTFKSSDIQRVIHQ